MNFVAASSVGKWPRVLMILRSCALMFSMAFVVQITLRTAGGNAKNGITRSQALRQAAHTVGYRCPQGPSANASSSACAASALGAV